MCQLHDRMVQNAARDCLLDEAAVENVETMTLDRVGGNDVGKRDDDYAERCSNGRGTERVDRFGRRCQHTALVFYGGFLCTIRPKINLNDFGGFWN